jgi:hypothetical protein
MANKAMHNINNHSLGVRKQRVKKGLCHLHKKTAACYMKIDLFIHSTRDYIISHFYVDFLFGDGARGAD